MANIKSAQKRISTIERKNKENRFVRATISTKVKKFRKMLEEGKVAEAEKYSTEVYSYIDSARSKGVIHKNAASRKIGRLAAALYKAKATVEPKVEAKVEKKEEVKEVETVATETAAPAKKTAAKKTTKKTETTEEKPAKKTTTKKTTKKAE